MRDPGPGDLAVGVPCALVAPLSVSPTTAFTVPAPPSTANQQVTVTCSLTDISTSTQTQTLTLTTNDPTQPTVSYAITCTGYAPAGGTGTGGGTGSTTPELPSGGLLSVGMVALVVARRWLRRHSLLACWPSPPPKDCSPSVCSGTLAVRSLPAATSATRGGHARQQRSLRLFYRRRPGLSPQLLYPRLPRGVPAGATPSTVPARPFLPFCVCRGQ